MTKGLAGELQVGQRGMREARGRGRGRIKHDLVEDFSLYPKSNGKPLKSFKWEINQ